MRDLRPHPLGHDDGGRRAVSISSLDQFANPHCSLGPMIGIAAVDAPAQASSFVMQKSVQATPRIVRGAGQQDNKWLASPPL